jgi:hypothetical protein
MNTEQEILGFDPSQLTVFNPENKPSSGNSLIYHTRPADSKSEDKYYRCTLKVIYNPFDIKNSIFEQQAYSMQDKDGFFQVVSSLTVNDTNCPIFKAWKKCHFAKKEENFDLWKQAAAKKDGGKQMFDKRFGRYVIVQVIEDKNQPQMENKYMIWKLPKTVYEMIQSKMKPAKEDNRASIPVMDFLFGRSIKLTVKPGPGKPGDIDYSRQTTYLAEFSEKTVPCKTPTGEPILNDADSKVLTTYVDAIKKVWESENEEERNTLMAQINSDPNTAELKKIYSKVIAQMKEWCPNLVDILGYKEWDEDTKKRVQAWINIILQGNDPAVTDPHDIPQSLNGNTQNTGNQVNTSTEAPAPVAENVQNSSASIETADTTGGDDDLPF